MIEIPSGDDPLARLETFRDRLFDLAADSIAHSTAAIVHLDDDKFREIRSGVLLQIDQMKFLVSAAHGIADHLDAGRPPFLLAGKDRKPGSSWNFVGEVLLRGGFARLGG